MVPKWSQNPWKIGPGTQQKTKLKNRWQQIKKYSKNDPQFGPKRWLYFGGGASWGTFGRPNRFWASNVAPQGSQSASNDRKINQKWPQRAPRLRKRASKFKLFGNLARRTARSAYNIRKNSKKRSVHEFRIDCPNDATPLMFASCGCVTFLHEPRSRSYGPYHEPTQIRLKFKWWPCNIATLQCCLQYCLQ